MNLGKIEFDRLGFYQITLDSGCKLEINDRQKCLGEFFCVMSLGDKRESKFLPTIKSVSNWAKNIENNFTQH